MMDVEGDSSHQSQLSPFSQFTLSFPSTILLFLLSPPLSPLSKPFPPFPLLSFFSGSFHSSSHHLPAASSPSHPFRHSPPASVPPPLFIPSHGPVPLLPLPSFHLLCSPSSSPLVSDLNPLFAYFPSLCISSNQITPFWLWEGE